MSDWKPWDHPALSPYLLCRDLAAEAAFLTTAFDAQELRRIARPDGSVMHLELLIGGTVVMLGGGGPEAVTGDPHLHFYVPDAEAAHARALEAGAEDVQAPVRKSPEDDMRGGFRDAEGVTWWVATA